MGSQLYCTHHRKIPPLHLSSKDSHADDDLIVTNRGDKMYRGYMLHLKRNFRKTLSCSIQGFFFSDQNLNARCTKLCHDTKPMKTKEEAFGGQRIGVSTNIWHDGFSHTGWSGFTQPKFSHMWPLRASFEIFMSLTIELYPSHHRLHYKQGIQNHKITRWKNNIIIKSLYI